MSEHSAVIGRLAPSPTGAQHVGNARTYLLAWLSIRARGGQMIVRIEDIDSPRVKRGAAEQALDDLAWLGLDWDQGPDCGGPHAPYVQAQRLPLYCDALARLQAAERVYPCTCSRSDVAAAASAPHLGQEGPVYPGTCAHHTAASILTGCAREREVDSSFAWRLRTSTAERHFDDLVAGPQSCSIATQLGDFIVAKADGAPAYQLAVVVDDHAMGVTEVLRGDDLLPSAFRQLELYDFFGWTPPQFAHVPLVVGSDGRRLAKRHGDTRLAALRDSGVPPERLVGLLAWSCGLIEHPVPIRPGKLIDSFELARVPRAPWVFRDEHMEWLTGQNV